MPWNPLAIFKIPSTFHHQSEITKTLPWTTPCFYHEYRPWRFIFVGDVPFMRPSYEDKPWATTSSSKVRPQRGKPCFQLFLKTQGQDLTACASRTSWDVYSCNSMYILCIYIYIYTYMYIHMHIYKVYSYIYILVVDIMDKTGLRHYVQCMTCVLCTVRCM